MTKQLSSLQRRRKIINGLAAQKGASIVESLLAIPALLLVGAGILHVALIAQAKSNLEYASLMAARIASTTPNFGLENGASALKAEVIKRMKASDPRNDDFRDMMDLVCISVIRPNAAAFNDFGQANIVPGSLAIPNDNLPFLSKDLGPQSGITVQDANVLHLRVAYRFDSNVPFMNGIGLGTRDDNLMSGHVQSRYAETGQPSRGTYGMWIQSDAVVVMQTPAQLNAITQDFISGSGSFTQCPSP